MPTFTTKLDGRKGPRIQPTIDEARAMHEKGFRFAIYRPEDGECSLSRPCDLLIAEHRNELTFQQP